RSAAPDLQRGRVVSVLRGELPGRVGAGGGVLAGAVPALVVGGVLLAGGDDEVALAVQGGVPGAARVVLPLVVVLVVAGIQLPLGGVDRRSGRAVEGLRDGHGRRGGGVGGFGPCGRGRSGGGVGGGQGGGQPGAGGARRGHRSPFRSADRGAGTPDRGGGGQERLLLIQGMR